MAEKDKFQKYAEQEDTGGTGGTKEPSQSTAEFYSRENAPTLEDFTSGSEERDQRQDLEDSDSVFKQADASDALDAHGGGDSSGLKGSSATEVPESSDVGSSLLNPSDPQAGRLGDRADDLGLRPDYTSLNVFDDAADAGGGSGGLAGMGKEGLISNKEATGSVGYGAGYDSEEGLQSTGSKPSGDSWLNDLAEGLSRAFIPGESSYGPTNQEFQRLEKEESGDPAPAPAPAPDTGGENPQSYTRTNPDGTVDVVKGDTMYHWDPATNTVTEKNTTTGETTTTSPDTGLFGIPDDEYETDLPPGFIDSEALLPPEMRTESILQNMTGAGQKGGEEVNPTREGGTGQSGGTATDDAFRQTKEEMIGQPDPDAAPHGGRAPGSVPVGPGQEEIDPGEDGSLPPGETRSEDLPGGTTSSEDTSLGLEGGHDGEFDFSGAAEEIQDAQNPPQLPPGYEDDTTDELDLTTTTYWAEQIQDAQNPPDLPPSFLDTTDGEFDFSGAAEQIQDAQNPPDLPPGYEDDTTDGLDLTTTTDWTEQIQDTLNPVEPPPEFSDTTDDVWF